MSSCRRGAFGDPDEEDGTGGGAAGERQAQPAAAPKSTKTANSNIMESLSEDGNINISNVTNVVVGRVGNLFGKSIGGLSSKLGGGGWF